MLAEAAHVVGIIPLTWLIGLRLGGVRRPAAWWLMAAAFAVSFVADSLAHVVSAATLSQVYLVTQAALFGFALAPRPVADRFVPVLLVAAGISLAVRQGAGLDWLLHVTAWGGVAWLAWRYVIRGTLRSTMAGGFVAAAVAWCWFVADPGWPAWLTYQGTRVVTATGWTWAAWRAGDTPTQAG